MSETLQKPKRKKPKYPQRRRKSNIGPRGKRSRKSGNNAMARVRMSQMLWDLVQNNARSRGMSASALCRDLIIAYLRERGAFDGLRGQNVT